MNGKILEHLRGRPIAPIVNASKETDDLRALKLLCVIDYNLEMSGAYPELRAIPKMMGQLLNFHSFGSFKYYKYNLPRSTFDYKILKCRNCELVGPYKTVIEHMVICHNIHVTTSKCLWCEKVDVQQHMFDTTLDQCYQAYLNQFSIGSYPPVITKVHKLLEKLAKSLNVRTLRNENFKNAHRSKEFDIIPPDQSDDIDHHIIVFRAKKLARKALDDDALDKLYRDAMQKFYGSDAIERFSIQTGNNSSQPPPPPPKRPSLNTTSNSVNSIAPVQFQTAQAQTQPILHIDQVHSMQSIPFDGNQAAPSIEDNFAFANFIASVLENIQDAQLRQQAKLDIQKITFEYSAQDVMKQIHDNNLK